MRKFFVVILMLLLASAAFAIKRGTTRVLADVTNGADDTYYYCVDSNGPHNYSGAQLVLSGGSGTVTVTVECTYVDDGTVCDSITEWDDVTNGTFGAASYAASTILVDNAQKLVNCRYYRYKVVAATGAADDADWKITHRKYFD